MFINPAVQAFIRGLTTHKDPVTDVEADITGGIQIFTSSAYRAPYPSEDWIEGFNSEADRRERWEENLRNVGKGTQEVLVYNEAIAGDNESQAVWEATGGLIWGESMITMWDIAATSSGLNWRTLGSGATLKPNLEQQNWLAYSYYDPDAATGDYLDEFKNRLSSQQLPYNNRHVLFALMNSDLLWLYPEGLSVVSGVRGATESACIAIGEWPDCAGDIWPWTMTAKGKADFYEAKHWNGGFADTYLCPCLGFTGSDQMDGKGFNPSVGKVQIALRGRWGATCNEYGTSHSTCSSATDRADYYCGGTDDFWPPSVSTPAYDMNRADVYIIEALKEWADDKY